jgi:hypothetical protein
MKMGQGSIGSGEVREKIMLYKRAAGVGEGMTSTAIGECPDHLQSWWIPCLWWKGWL